MKMDWPSAIKINWPPVWVSQAGLFYDFFSTRDQFRTSIYRIRFLWFISCLRGSQSRIPRNPKQENFFSKKVKYMKENWPLFFLRYGVNLKWFSGVNWISSQGVNSYHIFHVVLESYLIRLILINDYLNGGGLNNSVHIVGKEIIKNAFNFKCRKMQGYYRGNAIVTFLGGNYLCLHHFGWPCRNSFV